jgi:hypothetical protein
LVQTLCGEKDNRQDLRFSWWWLSPGMLHSVVGCTLIFSESIILQTYDTQSTHSSKQLETSDVLCFITKFTWISTKSSYSRLWYNLHEDLWNGPSWKISIYLNYIKCETFSP